MTRISSLLGSLLLLCALLLQPVRARGGRAGGGLAGSSDSSRDSSREESRDSSRPAEKFAHGDGTAHNETAEVPVQSFMIHTRENWTIYGPILACILLIVVCVGYDKYRNYLISKQHNQDSEVPSDGPSGSSSSDRTITLIPAHLPLRPIHTVPTPHGSTVGAYGSSTVGAYSEPYQTFYHPVNLGAYSSSSQQVVGWYPIIAPAPPSRYPPNHHHRAPSSSSRTPSAKERQRQHLHQQSYPLQSRYGGRYPMEMQWLNTGSTVEQQGGAERWISRAMEQQGGWDNQSGRSTQGELYASETGRSTAATQQGYTSGPGSSVATQPGYTSGPGSSSGGTNSAAV